MVHIRAPTRHFRGIFDQQQAEYAARPAHEDHERRDGMLKPKVATRLPAKDLDRARAFYSEKLGLEPVEQREGGLRYVCAAGEFAIFISTGVQSGTHTQMGWEVDDIEATMRELRARGVEFEDYDLPGLRTVDGIAEIWGNYPSKGTGERGAWFREAKETCWESGSRFGLDGSARPLVARLHVALRN
jgi:catechol 2,3-dioxygenase-like lactoylglutathione lyase family enzyme